MSFPHFPELFSANARINLYQAHVLYGRIAEEARRRFALQSGHDIAFASGIWGGSYLIAQKDGVARTNIVRLYCINSLPQNTALDDPEVLRQFMSIYQQTLSEAFRPHNIILDRPQWGETVPYTNHRKPNFVLHLWDASGRIRFLRAFFVWNRAGWEESLIYDMLRNIKQVKEYLNVHKRLPPRAPDELKFVLQDVLIIYYTLKPALDPDFVGHAEPLIGELLDRFLSGLHDKTLIETLFNKVRDHLLIYGCEHAPSETYLRYGLDIRRIEEWPVEKINWVPEELKAILIPHIASMFDGFRNHQPTASHSQTALSSH